MEKRKEDKQKVTLYLPPELHRQLKIRAAVDAATMTDIAQRALVFYLNHQEVVDQYESPYGHTHQVYSCPDCNSSVVLREGEMVSLSVQPSLVVEDSLSLEKARLGASIDSQGEGELVPC